MNTNMSGLIYMLSTHQAKEPTNKAPEVDEKIVFVPRKTPADEDVSSPDYIYRQVCMYVYLTAKYCFTASLHDNCYNFAR